MTLLLWTTLLAILARGSQAADSRIGDLAAAIAAMGAAQDCDVQVTLIHLLNTYRVTHYVVLLVLFT